jgi:Phasin protein
MIGAGYAHAQTAKQGYPMSGFVCSETASDRERETYPIVYFEDLALDIPVKDRGDAQEPPGFRPEVAIAAFDKAIDAAAERTRLLQGEMIGIAQRNVNAILNQLWKLAGAKSLGEILDLQAAYCRNQLGAFIRQVEEIQAVSMQSYARQAQELGGLIAEAMRSSKPKD